jgi:hypothetical protein
LGKTKICELEFVVKRTIKHDFPDSFSQHYILPLFSSLLEFLYEILFLVSILSLFYHNFRFLNQINIPGFSLSEFYSKKLSRAFNFSFPFHLSTLILRHGKYEISILISKIKISGLHTIQSSLVPDNNFFYSWRHNFCLIPFSAFVELSKSSSIEKRRKILN